MAMRNRNSILTILQTGIETTMPIKSITNVNKRLEKVELDSGVTVELRVENMHEMAVYSQDEEVCRLRFFALSSLNNIDISPTYSLQTFAFPSLTLISEARVLRTAAIALFKTFTNGKIRISQEIEDKLLALEATDLRLTTIDTA